MDKFKKFLSKISAEMKENRLTRPLYLLLLSLGLIRFGRHLFYLWFQRNPTPKMKYEKQFFTEHAQELKAVYDSLEDDRSKTIFENLIKFRATADWACFKRYSRKEDERNQYFVPELRFSDHEIIVDCGAFNGDTTELFYKKIPGCKVIALEPEEKNFESLQKLKLPGLKCIKAGAWSEDTVLRFADEGGGGSTGTITASGNAEIEVKALDHLSECQSATYIKMDIEGAELEALKGAKQIIKSKRPKLAICIYHHPQDLFEIPLYIRKLNPDYKLYVHHHGEVLFETVLYAI